MNRRQKLVQKQFLNNETEVIKRLEKVYGVAQKDINDKIKNLQLKIDQLQLEYDWMDDDDPAKQKVKSMIQSKIYQKKYQQALGDQIDGILKQMQAKGYLTISDYLDECYEDGFVGSLFDLHGQDVPLMIPLDQTKMVEAVQLDSKISEGLYTRLGEDVGLLKRKITAQVSRSIATGISYGQTAKLLAGYTRIGYNNAIRITRTEGHRIQTTATMHAMEQAKDRGADVAKQWDATLDARTRESHAMVDGEIRELDERFSNGLMYPGDPDGRAAEVINCRCALLQRARWALEGGFTKVNSFTKEIETFDSPEDYTEFKKAFFSKENRNYMNYVEQMEEKYGTKDFEKVLDSMTDREYNHYSKLLANNPVYNKKAPVSAATTAPVKTSDVFRSSDVIELQNRMAKLEAQANETMDFNELIKIQEEQDRISKRISEIRAELVEKSKKQTVASAQKTIRSTGLFKEVDIENCDADVAKAIQSTVEKFHARYPEVVFRKLKITEGNMTGEVNTLVDSLGKTPGTSVMFNGAYFNNSLRLANLIEEQHKSGWASFDSVEGLVAHEFGHAICHYYDVSTADIFGKVMTNSGLSVHKSYVGKDKELFDSIMHISRYGDHSADEWFSECFANYLTSEEPEEISRKAMTVFNEMVSKKNKK